MIAAGRATSETRGCITVSVGAVNDGQVSVAQLHYPVSMSVVCPSVPICSTAACMNAVLDVHGFDAGNAYAEAVRHSIGITCTLVCDVTTSKYLRVTPVETMWIDVDNDIDYFVRSNTDWNVN